MSTVPDIDNDKCTGCGTCVDACPAGAVELIDGKPMVVRPEDCTYCTDCEERCPAGAIECPFEIVLQRPAST
ncbi:MAG: 4Fe-4S binding protein [Chloroflexi bacterium]|nr:4Fe-4S binding protein [Chloroflexota bacterium]